MIAHQDVGTDSQAKACRHPGEQLPEMLVRLIVRKQPPGVDSSDATQKQMNSSSRVSPAQSRQAGQMTANCQRTCQFRLESPSRCCTLDNNARE
jgi:hypothetical protein